MLDKIDLLGLLSSSCVKILWCRHGDCWSSFVGKLGMLDDVVGIIGVLLHILLRGLWSCFYSVFVCG